MQTEHARFTEHIDQAVASLRERLMADVKATAERDQRRGGIRHDWRQLVRRLAELRAVIGPAPGQPSAATAERT